jgi:hypothetical protein
MARTYPYYVSNSLNSLAASGWSALLARPLRESMAWLKGLGMRGLDARHSGIKPADSYLWAEGPLPNALAVCLNCEASGREGQRDGAPSTPHTPLPHGQRALVPCGKHSLH